VRTARAITAIMTAFTTKSRLAVASIFFSLVALVQGSHTVTLGWDINPEPDIAGYRLKYGPSSGGYVQTIDVGNTNAATVGNLSSASTYFFVVTAYNTAELESLPSEEISFTTAATKPPTITLTSAIVGGAITLTAVVNDASATIMRVEFYHGTTKLGESTGNTHTITWAGASGDVYNVSARAIDHQGTSTDSAPLEVTVPPPAATPPQITALERLADGRVRVTSTGEPGAALTVHASQDMKTWTLLNTDVTTTGTLVSIDAQATPWPQRFYRVADASVTSDAAGFVTLGIRGANPDRTPSMSHLATALMNPTLFEGDIDVAEMGGITDHEAKWTGHEFTADGRFYLEISSGPHAGTTTDILGCTESGKELKTEEDLTPLLTGGERYRIRKHRTLGEIFGRDNEAGLHGGASAASADEVRVFNPVTQTFTTFFYKTGGFGGIGWRSTSNATDDASNFPLFSDHGLIVRRKVAGDLSVFVTGTVKTGPTVVPVGPLMNLAANVYPAGNLQLKDSGLYSGDDSIGLAGGTSASSADEVRVFDGTAFRTYYYKAGGFGGIGWRDSQDALVDAAETSIPAGSAVFIIRKPGRPAFNWTVPQPF